MMSDSKKVVPPKGKKTHTEMLIDPSLRGGYQRVRRRSALDDEFEAEEDDQARKLRELRVEEMTVKREARIAKLRREIEEPPVEAKAGGDTKFSSISMTVARQIAALPEEERNRVLETYMLMQAAEAKQANAVLPAIVGFARANPGSSQNSMVEYAKLANEQLKTGIDLARGNETKTQTVDFWKPIEMMRDLIKDSVKEPIDKLAESMQPQQGFFESLLLNPQLFERAKDLGIFGRREGGGGTTEMDLKIEQLRTERDLGMKKIDLEWKKSMLEREAQDKKTDAVLTALAPMSAIFAGPLNQRMRQLGQQQAATHNPGGIPPGVMPPQNTILIRCTCGYQGPMTFPGPPPPIFKCPSCSQDLVVGGAPGVSGNPEKGHTGT